MADLLANVTRNVTEAEIPQTLFELTELSLSANLFWWSALGFLALTVVAASAGSVFGKLINAAAALFMRHSGMSEKRLCSCLKP
jgi:hypothetical protein